jgi:hypothetical protein
VSEGPELYKERVVGVERYPVTAATWNVYHDEDADCPMLCLKVEAGEGATISEPDEEPLFALPWWEVNVASPSMTPASLQPGVRFEVPTSYDDELGYVTNYYDFSHDGTDENVVEVLAVEGARVRARLTGTRDDATRAGRSRATVRVEAWFEHDPRTKRSVT